jgi:hypothetical protein
VLFKLPLDAVSVLVAALIHNRGGGETRPYRMRAVATPVDTKVEP